MTDKEPRRLPDTFPTAELRRELDIFLTARASGDKNRFNSFSSVSRVITPPHVVGASETGEIIIATGAFATARDILEQENAERVTNGNIEFQLRSTTWGEQFQLREQPGTTYAVFPFSQTEVTDGTLGAGYIRGLQTLSNIGTSLLDRDYQPINLPNRAISS